MSDKYINYCNNLYKYKTFINSMKDKYIGIPNTFSNYIIQGFCIVDKYVLITAYDSTKENNSIIYLLDLNGNLIKVVYLDGKYHCGGISYHSKSKTIYITGKGGINSYINKYSFIDILNNDKVLALSKFRVDDDNILISSITKKSSVAYLTIYKDYLYLGNFSTNNKGKIKKYMLDNNGNIILDSCIIINNPYKKTQGICLYELDGINYCIFSTSFGRVNSSIIYITKLDNNKFSTIKRIKFPVMSEQVNINEFKEISVMFESCCLRFKGIKNRVSDICFFDLNKLL